MICIVLPLGRKLVYSTAVPAWSSDLPSLMECVSIQETNQDHRVQVNSQAQTGPVKSNGIQSNPTVASQSPRNTGQILHEQKQMLAAINHENHWAVCWCNKC